MNFIYHKSKAAFTAVALRYTLLFMYFVTAAAAGAAEDRPQKLFLLSGGLGMSSQTFSAVAEDDRGGYSSYEVSLKSVQLPLFLSVSSYNPSAVGFEFSAGFAVGQNLSYTRTVYERSFSDSGAASTFNRNQSTFFVEPAINYSFDRLYIATGLRLDYVLEAYDKAKSVKGSSYQALGFVFKTGYMMSAGAVIISPFVSVSYSPILSGDAVTKNELEDSDHDTSYSLFNSQIGISAGISL